MPESHSRRDFLRVSAVVTGGMMIAIAFPRAAHAAAGGTEDPWEPNAFVRIDPDGTITITVPRPDMGQGVRTSLSAIVAEELDADWSRLRLEQADYAATRYGPQYSGGSSSVRDGWAPLRAAGATARAMLVAAAAAQWGVNVAECATERGEVVHVASRRRFGYGALASAAAALPVPADVPLKASDAYRLVGTRIPSVDAPAIVRGEVRYGLDQRVPGMLFATIERSPTIGATVARVDAARARAVAGVLDVVTIDAGALPSFGNDNPRPPSGVAVIAGSTWAAMQGRRALRIDWTPGAGVAESSTRIREQSLALLAKPADRVILADGNAAEALQRAARTVEAVYELPLLAHTPMEPMNCLADCRDDRCTVWAPIQNPAGAHLAIQRVTKLPPEAITVHVTRSGGGFGRRFYADFVAEAVILSRTAHAPVQAVWTREDDVRFGFYRPSSVQGLKAGLSADGQVVAWTHHVVNAARGEFLEWAVPAQFKKYPAGMGEVDRNDFPSTLLPDFTLQASRIVSRIPLGQWRAVDSSSNFFAIESFFDEVARAAGRDPLEMKLAMLARTAAGIPRRPTYDLARQRAVFQLAAEKGNWGAPLPAGWGRGLAGGYSNGAYVAEVAEVEVLDNAITVRRVVAAVDCGRVVNRSGAEAQVEGAIIYGLSAALLERITVEGGRVQQSNFHDFPALRQRDTPRIEAHFVPSEDLPLGLGEGALPSVAPAVANAVFAATGRRLRTLPLSL